MTGEPELWTRMTAERKRVARICDEVKAQVDREFRIARNDGGLEVVHRWPTPAPRRRRRARRYQH
jgi:hypothetical protein